MFLQSAEKPTPIAALNYGYILHDPDSGQLVDQGIALALIVFLLPLLLVVALLVCMTSRGPVFFKQRRIGRNGVPFECYKFRTMQVDAETRLSEFLRKNPVARQEWERDQKLRSDPRITAVGLFLRKSSIDELPQLFNVMLREMRLVGPRPIVENEISRYGKYFDKYCSVRPGITGLWQISGRNDVSYRRRVAYDVIYSRRRSMMGDFGILFATIPCVLARRGSY